MILVPVLASLPYIRYMLMIVLWLLKRTFKFVIYWGLFQGSSREAVFSYGLCYLIDKKAYMTKQNIGEKDCRFKKYA